MVSSQEQRDADLIAARKQRSVTAARTDMGTNPYYGTSQFEPESYIPTADPNSAKPLISGRYADPRIPSPLAQTRAMDIQEFRKDPKKYVEQTAQQLNNEQSLLDKGATIMSRVFNYRDEADASLFGVDLSAVESVWDNSLRYITGAYDLLNLGIGALVSAAPGGVRTYEFSELSGGKNLGEVVSGEMEPGSAPSVGQIAITSVALEAKRIREGNARLSDVLLLNPATAPFILAGIAAESSPLQQEGFDLMNKAQREKAFGSGWEQWMSGLTDAGATFADPTIAAGAVLKVARLGALGQRSGLKYAKDFGTVSDDALDILTTAAGDARKPVEIFQDIANRGEAFNAATMQQGGVLKLVKDTGEVPLNTDIRGPRITTKTPLPESDNPLVGIYHRLAMENADGTPTMTAKQIEKMPEISALDNRGSVAQLLEDARGPLEVAAVWESITGTPQALERLNRLAPALADQAFRLERQRVAFIAANSEPQKIKEASDTISKTISNFEEQMKTVQKQLDDLAPDGKVSGLDPEKMNQYTRLIDRQRTYQQSLDESRELYDIIANGKIIEPLDPTSPFYNKIQAYAVIDDLHRSQTVIERALNREIFEAAQGARFQVPIKNNAYARAVSASRQRRGTAAAQYAEEGTGILPKKYLAETLADGTKIYKDSGWFSPSKFEGVSRLQRNARVWRWLGTETPSGWIGLRATATVGAEREFNAALDLDIYKNKPIKVTRNVPTQLTDDAGKPMFDAADNPIMGTKPEEFEIGGAVRRNELFSEFYAALNDPNKDSLKALMDVEAKIMDDYAYAYGYDSQQLQKVLQTANRRRAADLDLVRSRGYFIDSDGTRHYVPYLETHLANGTYMQNFQQLEKILSKDARETGGQKVRAALDTPLHLAGNAYEVFNNFWRPATLMRLSYTQRNVFEGMARAMAYSASLAPLSWPVRATVNGTRNKITKHLATSRVARAEKAISESSLGEYMTKFDDASSNYYHLNTAMELQELGDAEPMMYLLRKDPGRQGTFERMSKVEYERRMTESFNAMSDAQDVIRSKADEFTSVIEGTEFSKWRKRELDDVNSELAKNQKRIDVLTELIQDAQSGDNPLSILNEPGLLNTMAEVANVAAIQGRKRDNLMYNPARSIAEYRGAAGRQRRIGSGHSMGPDGNYYNDAFAGPMEQINRGQMSADNTVKQSLSLNSDVYNSLFRKVMVRDNEAISYLGHEDQWVDGLIGAIEDASSSRIVARLVENDWNTEDAVKWMMSDDPDARTFTTRIMSMFGSTPENPVRLNDIPQVALDRPSIYVEGQRLKPFAEEVRTPSGQRVVNFDIEDVRAYVGEVATRVQTQMQGNNAFLTLLKRRVGEKSVKTTSKKVDASEIKAILSQMTPEQRANLGFIQGAEIVQMGSNRAGEIWASLADKMFKFLGTIPEDAVTRGPFYNMRFKSVRNELIENYWQRQGIKASEVKRKTAKGAAGDSQGMTIEHDEFQIPADEISRIEVRAHRRALMDTKEWMYTIDRRTKLGKYGEWIYPFISATQNSTVTIGKLLWKEPWLAPMIYDLWRMPSRIGIEDEEGNIKMPMPLGWVQKALQDHPEIPFIGGMLDSQDMITIPKNGLNVWMPETGFGILPRPTPWIQMGASELMKMNAFPVETPQPLKSMFGDDLGDQIYTSFKDYMFGEEGTLSSTTLSLDKLLPAWSQKLVQLKSELSAQYGYQYALQYNTQIMRWRGGERDTAPTEDEIAKRTTNMFWFYALGNLGVPTPLTPYPILTRPQVENTPVQGLQDIYQMYRESDPMNASMNMDKMFGDWGFEAALTKVSENVGGANPTAQAVSDIKTFSPLIREIAPDLGDNLDVIGIIVNNRGSSADYEDAAYQWQKSATIPGTNREYREVQSPEQAVAERQRVVGWTMYRSFMDQLDARLNSAGLDSYEVAAAAPFKAAKDQFVANMRQNPEVEGWLVDYQDIGGNRTGAAVRAIQAAITDTTFQKEMYKDGKQNLLGAMNDYVYYRNGLINMLQESGHGIDHESNTMLKLGWAKIRQDLKATSPRWAEIADLYLSGDDNPQNPGAFIDPNTPLPQGMMQGVQ